MFCVILVNNIFKAGKLIFCKVIAMKKLVLVFGIIILSVLIGYYFINISNSEVIKMEYREGEKPEVATFAGGCFWCVESDFEKLNGVVEVISGFSGGDEINPTYNEVASGSTGHIESVQVYYYSDVVSYNDLLEHFFKTIDPTDDGGSFVDRGYQYSSAIFYHDENQKFLAEYALRKLEEAGIFDKPIATKILKFKSFYEAEEYHQDYYKKSSIKYKFYRANSGRDSFIKKTWSGNDDSYDLDSANTKEELENEKLTEGSKALEKYKRPSDLEIKNKLTKLQYDVTQKSKTERSFNNAYWDNTEEGIYVDIVSGEPLFSSTDKYKSGTGWPSFTKPIANEYIIEKEDKGLFLTRTEVRSAYGDSHLGHVFNDGPKDKGGLRYCMNSAAMKFIPKSDLEKEGYKEYLDLFQ